MIVCNMFDLVNVVNTYNLGFFNPYYRAYLI